MAPLQKRAWWGLIIGLAFAVAFALVFILMGGIGAFDEDQDFRIIIDVLWIGGLLANLVIMELTLRKPAQVDERDRMIQGRAPRVETKRRPEIGGGATSMYHYDEYAYGVRSSTNWLFEIQSDATAPTS